MTIAILAGFGLLFLLGWPVVVAILVPSIIYILRKHPAWAVLRELARRS